MMATLGFDAELACMSAAVLNKFEKLTSSVLRCLRRVVVAVLVVFCFFMCCGFVWCIWITCEIRLDRAASPSFDGFRRVYEKCHTFDQSGTLKGTYLGSTQL